MGTYLCVDGGGTKCCALLFSGDFRLLGQGRGGGINANTLSPAVCGAHVKACLDAVFQNHLPAFVDAVYVVYVGDTGQLRAALEARVAIGRFVVLDEGEAGLLAGMQAREGILALAGTGSDVFYIRNNGVDAGEQPIVSVVGGWGPLLGDEGGGVWIGRSGLQAAIRAYEGWGAPTSLTKLIVQAWSLDTLREVIEPIYRDASPTGMLASFAPLVGQAAAQGDAVARGILSRAGELMGLQALCLMGREQIPPAHWRMTCCGGAWKTHPCMYEAFAQTICAQNPQVCLRKPVFEHVMAGVVLHALSQGMSPGAARALLSGRFGDYTIRW